VWSREIATAFQDLESPWLEEARCPGTHLIGEGSLALPPLWSASTHSGQGEKAANLSLPQVSEAQAQGFLLGS
jgi:hypothetical protein